MGCKTVGNIKNSDLKFMESKHSYMETDNIHATVKRYRRHWNLYVPNEYKILFKMHMKMMLPYKGYQI